MLLQVVVGVRVGGGRGEGAGSSLQYLLTTHNFKHITFLPPLHTHTHTPTHTHTHTHTGKDINAFAFSLLNLPNPLIFQIVKYAKVMEVNR